jgi:NAD(P)-dependent dehydrogenase (short-subunit alcohol dehydrogenase family)
LRIAREGSRIILVDRDETGLISLLKKPDTCSGAAQAARFCMGKRAPTGRLAPFRYLFQRPVKETVRLLSELETETSVSTFCCDLTAPTQITDLVTNVRSTSGGLDVLGETQSSPALDRDSGLDDSQIRAA